MQDENDPRKLYVEIYLTHKDCKRFLRIKNLKFFKEFIIKYFPPLSLECGGPIYKVKSSSVFSDESKNYFKLIVEYYNPYIKIETANDTKIKYLEMCKTFENMKNAIFNPIAIEVDEEPDINKKVIEALETLSNYFEYYKKINNIEIEGDESKSNEESISKE